LGKELSLTASSVYVAEAVCKKPFRAGVLYFGGAVAFFRVAISSSYFFFAAVISSM
jgi:hypothetical protein